MMRKLTNTLLLFLTAQLALVIGLNLSMFTSRTEKATPTVITSDLDACDEIKIETSKDGSTPLTLKRQGKTWTIPQYFDFPANKDGVESFTKKLEKLKGGWPVATTTGATRRFKVASDDFERRVTYLKSGNVVAQLYVGTSPGYKKSHVRLEGSNDIFAVELASFELNDQPRDWIDKSYYSFKPNTISRIELPQYTIEKKKKKWVLVAGNTTRDINQSKAGELVGYVRNIPIQSVEGTEEKPEFNLASPFMVLNVTAGGRVSELKLAKPEQGSQFILKSSDKKFYAGVDNYFATRIGRITRDDLLKLDSAGKKKPEKTKDKS